MNYLLECSESLSIFDDSMNENSLEDCRFQNSKYQLTHLRTSEYFKTYQTTDTKKGKKIISPERNAMNQQRLIVTDSVKEKFRNEEKKSC